MTSSNDRLQNWTPDAEGPEFLGLNLEALRGLANFADVSEGFTLAVAEVNLATDADLLIQALKARPECEQVQFEVLDFAGVQVKSLLDELVAKLPLLPAAAEPKQVLTVRGLETSIGAVHDNPPFLQDLNFIRDALARQVAYPLILVLPKYAVKRMARFARDFWAWASLVLEFRSVQHSVETLRTETLTPGRLFSSDPKPAKEGRIQQLHQLLEEYAPTAQQTDSANADIRLDILQELGNAYLSLADVGRAERCFRQMLELSQISEQRLRQANALLRLGTAVGISKTKTTALEIFEDALATYREVGDRLGEASTLQGLGSLQDADKGLKAFLAAQEIYQAIGDRYSQGRNLVLFIGPAYLALKHLDDAKVVFQSAAEIGQAIGFEPLTQYALEQLSHCE